MPIQKSHIYKVFRSGVYLGLINPTNPFTYALDINSAGTQMTLDVPISIDVSSQATEAIMDETGSPLLTEDGEPLLTEKQPEVVGSSSDTIKLRNGNIVKVYEFSSYNPNGKLMFTGRIDQWEGEFGDGSSDVVRLLVKSIGQDLDNYLIQL
jgi:hypothetical protein